MSSRPAVIVLTAPSGAGKTSIARRLLAHMPSLRFSVSATTRPPRKGETDGVDYHFLSPLSFRERIEQGELLEFEEVYPDRFYGTLKEEVERSSRENPVLLDIDVRGAERVRDLFGKRAFVVFIKPPSFEILKRRLRRRRSETAADLAVRLDRIRFELTFEDRFDARVVNDDLDRAAAETITMVETFLRDLALIERQTGTADDRA